MDPLRIRFIDRKGFERTEWITDPLTLLITRRFALEPADAAGERSVELRFARAEQSGDCVVYRELV